MPTSVPVSTARADLPALLTRVEAGEEVTITRHGRAVAVLVSPAALRVRRNARVFAEAEYLDRLLAEGRERSPSAAPSLSAEAAEALVAQVRADRDAS